MKLSKQKVIVKHLDAIQNFGAMDILCTDKTGTLTRIRLCWRTIPTSPARSASGYCMPPAQQPLPDRPENLLDTAVLDGVELDAARGLAERWQKVDEILRLRTPPHVGGGEGG